MYKAKFGKWYEKNPQLARANNSVVLLRHRIEKEVFENLWKDISNAKTGEPGFVFSNNAESYGVNPCQPAYATILTEEGIRTIEDIKEGDKIWDGECFTKVVKKWNNGIKNVYEYHTRAGIFIGTDTHKIVQNGVKTEVKDADTIDVCKGLYKKTKEDFDIQSIMDGLVLGDGSVHKASNNLIGLHIGEKDKDYLNSEIACLLKRHRPGVTPTFWEIKTTLTPGDLCHTYDRTIPKRFKHGDRKQIVSFLRGLFSANGSIAGNRVTLKAASKKVILDVQLMLSSVGICSYYTINKSKVVTFSNGDYRCKQSYDLNITADRRKFLYSIDFIQKYKQEKLFEICETETNHVKDSFEIKEVIDKGKEEVFDIMVENQKHVYWTGGLLVSNCGEAALRQNTACNLTEINCSNLLNQSDFNERAKCAAFLGTLQATYTDFHFLRPIWKMNSEKDSLIGVSLTGIAYKGFSDFDLKKVASIVKKENERVAELLNIHKAARTTLIKPSGTISALCSCSSGVHAWHAPYYIRRIRLNKDESIARYISKKLPELVEEDVEKPELGIILSLPIKAPEDAILKTEETAIEFLERIKWVYNNWIKPGHKSGPNTHSVSATVDIKENEWKEVGKWMWENRDYYNCLSTFPHDGMIYPQMPLESCSEERYNELMAYVTQIDLSDITEEEDNTRLQEEVTCSGGACEIKSL
jgi:hypothetical protein